MTDNKPSPVLTGWLKARARQQVAAGLEDTLLYAVVNEAKETGTSIRELSRQLDVPKSTLARYWHRPRQPKALPVWGNPTEYAAAQRAIWSHDPENVHAMPGLCPWIWEDTPAGRTVRAAPLQNGARENEVPTLTWLDVQYRADWAMLIRATKQAHHYSDHEGVRTVQVVWWVFRHLRWTDRDISDLTEAFVGVGGNAVLLEDPTIEGQKRFLDHGLQDALKWCNTVIKRKNKRSVRKNAAETDALRELEGDILSIIRLLDTVASEKPVTPDHLWQLNASVAPPPFRRTHRHCPPHQL